MPRLTLFSRPQHIGFLLVPFWACSHGLHGPMPALHEFKLAVSPSRYDYGLSRSAPRVPPDSYPRIAPQPCSRSCVPLGVVWNSIRIEFAHSSFAHPAHRIVVKGLLRNQEVLKRPLYICGIGIPVARGKLTQKRRKSLGIAGMSVVKKVRDNVRRPVRNKTLHVLHELPVNLQQHRPFKECFHALSRCTLHFLHIHIIFFFLK